MGGTANTNYIIDSATGPCKFYFCTGSQRKSLNVKNKCKM